MASIGKKCTCANPRRCAHSWVVRYRVGGRGSTQREKAFKPAQYDNAYQSAKEFAADVEGQKATGRLRNTARADRIRFEDYARSVLESRSGLAPATATRYASVLEHAYGAIGPLPLANVDRRTLQAAVNAHAKTGANPAPLVTAVSMVLTRAVQDELLASNPMAFVETPRADAPEVVVPTDAELAALYKELPEWLRLTVYLMAGLGLRPSEALAAHTRCVRDDGTLYRVSEQVLTSRTTGPLKHRKAGEFRDVPLAAYVADAIAATEITDGYLIPAPKANFVTRRVLERRFSGTGFTPKALRHRFATVALAAGEPLTDVSAWLGHRDVNVTYRTYRHWLPTRSNDARKTIEAHRWDAHTNAHTLPATDTNGTTQNDTHTPPDLHS